MSFYNVPHTGNTADTAMEETPIALFFEVTNAIHEKNRAMVRIEMHAERGVVYRPPSYYKRMTLAYNTPELESDSD